MTLHIGILLFPDVQQLDLTGPYEIFASTPDTQVHLLWKELGPVPSATGLPLMPTGTLADCPLLDVLVVPGGRGVNELMQDEEVIAFLRFQASQVRYLTAVCTGSLVLGAAGLLQGRKATTHWFSHDLLERFGAHPVKQRVVRDGTIITAGGVTAGIDFALTIVAELFGEGTAQEVQLALEYAPLPPFEAGTPETAPPSVMAAVSRRLTPTRVERETILDRLMRRLLRTAAMLSVLALAAAGTWSMPAEARTDPATKKVAILIFDQVQVIDYSGPLEVLSSAGFDVFTVAATKAPVTTSAGDAVMLTPKYTFEDAPQADVVIIPGGGFEAPKDSPTVAWIKRAADHAKYTMSVCNGAFTLANTGLLDGKSATTTAGNINRLRQTYPAIKVMPEKRVVDNGRIITTAGLSAGIDGAFHLVDLMKGEGAGRSVALYEELDWNPDKPYVRGIMADRLLPPSIIWPLKLGEMVDMEHKGDVDHWQTTLWFTTQQSPAAILAQLKSGYEKGYRAEGGPWAPASLKLDPASPQTATLRYDDRDGRHWKTTVAVEQVEGEAHQVAIRVTVEAAG